MKNIFKYFGGAAVCGLMLLSTACNDVDFTTPNAGGIPKATDYENMVQINVDQESNQVTFLLNAPGVMPVWIIDGTNFSTRNGLQKIYAKAGEYEIEVKILNSNGVSDGSIFKTFTIENTIVNYDKYLSYLAGSDGSRQWRIDNAAEKHLGCGEPNTDGTNWWSAKADEKNGTGLYDNRLSFAKDYTYTFDPGENGTMYVNFGTKALNDVGATEDFSMPVELQTSTFAFETKGEDLYLTFPKGTYFPYIANDAIWEEPRYKVLNMTATAMELVADNGEIAWHYLLTSQAGAVTFKGFKYDSDFNLWRTAEVSKLPCYYAPGWTKIDDPEVNLSEDNSVISFTLPQATSERWQAQIPFMTNIPAQADKKYDVSFIISSSTAGKMMFKFTDATSDDNFICAKEFDVPGGYVETVCYVSDVNEKLTDDAAALKLFMDFGGFPDNTEVEIKNIVLKDHANDDGTVLPETGGEDQPGGNEGNVTWVDVNSPDNLMNSGVLGLQNTFWANAANWDNMANAVEVKINANTAQVIVAEANGPDQWKGQVHLTTNVSIEADAAYDFSITLNPSQDYGNATLKPHPQGDDANFFSEAQHALTAYEDNVIRLENVSMKVGTENLVITLDFPGSAAGTTIDIKDIIIQRHNESAPAGGNWPAVGDAANLMNSGALGIQNTFWAAGDDWHGLTAPDVTINGNTANIKVNEANGSIRWQGQIHLTTNVSIAADKKYGFRITLNASQDYASATVKPHPQGDDANFFSDATHALTAYEDVVIEYDNVSMPVSTDNLVITLDLPSSLAGTEIEVKDIIICER